MRVVKVSILLPILLLFDKGKKCVKGKRVARMGSDEYWLAIFLGG